jgi:hypothetical protein
VDDVVVRAVEGEMLEHAEPEHERRRDSPPLVRVERHSRRDATMRTPSSTGGSDFSHGRIVRYVTS